MGRWIMSSWSVTAFAWKEVVKGCSQGSLIDWSEGKVCFEFLLHPAGNLFDAQLNCISHFLVYCLFRAALCLLFRNWLMVMDLEPYRSNQTTPSWPTRPPTYLTYPSTYLPDLSTWPTHLIYLPVLPVRQIDLFWQFRHSWMFTNIKDIMTIRFSQFSEASQTSNWSRTAEIIDWCDPLTRDFMILVLKTYFLLFSVPHVLLW